MVDSKKLSIRDRIRAMNSTLDMVDQEQPTISSLRAVLGISSSDSSLTETSSLRQKEQTSTDGHESKDPKSSLPNQPIQKRSSVVEIWRQREGKPPLNGDTYRTDVHNAQQARPTNKFTQESVADTNEDTAKRFDQFGASIFPSYRKNPLGEEKKEMDSFETDTEPFQNDSKCNFSPSEMTMNNPVQSSHIPQTPKASKLRSKLSQDSTQLSDVTSKTFASPIGLSSKNPTTTLEESSSSDFAEILSKFDKPKPFVLNTSSETKKGTTNSRQIPQGIFRASNTTVENEAPADQVQECTNDTNCADHQVELRHDPDPENIIQSDGPKVKSILRKKQTANAWLQKKTDEKRSGSREEEPSDVEGIGTSTNIQWNQRLKLSGVDESMASNSKNFSKPSVDREVVSSSVAPGFLKKSKTLIAEQSDTTKTKNKVDLIKNQLEANKKSSKMGLDKDIITNFATVKNSSIATVESQKRPTQTEIGKLDKQIKSIRDTPERNSAEVLMSKQKAKDTMKSEINNREPKSVIDRWSQNTKQSNTKEASNKETNNNSYAANRTWYSRKTFSPRHGLKKVEREQGVSAEPTKGAASASRDDVIESKYAGQNIETGQAASVESINVREFWKAKAAVSPKIEISVSTIAPVEPPTILPRGSNNLRIASPRVSPKKKVAKGAVYNTKTGEYERIRNPVFFRDEGQERSDTFLANARYDPAVKDYKSIHRNDKDFSKFTKASVDSEGKEIQSNDLALQHPNKTPTHGFEQARATDKVENSKPDYSDFEVSKRNLITEKFMWMDSSESATSFTEESVSSDDLSRSINVPPSEKGQNESLGNHKILQQWRLATKTISKSQDTNVEVMAERSNINENMLPPAQAFYVQKPQTSKGEKKSEEIFDINPNAGGDESLENQAKVGQHFGQGNSIRHSSMNDKNIHSDESTSTPDNLSHNRTAHTSTVSLNVATTDYVQLKSGTNAEIKSLDDNKETSETEIKGYQIFGKSSLARQERIIQGNNDWYENEDHNKVSDGRPISEANEQRKLNNFLKEQYASADNDIGLSSLSDAASDPSLDSVLLHSESNVGGSSQNASEPQLNENIQNEPEERRHQYNEIDTEANSQRAYVDSKINVPISHFDLDLSTSQIPAADSSEESLLIRKIEANSGHYRTNGRSRSANPSNRRKKSASALDRIAVRSLSPPGHRSNHSLSESGIDEEYITSRASLWVEVQRRKRQSTRTCVNPQNENVETSCDFNNLNEIEKSPSEKRSLQQNESVQTPGRNSKSSGKSRPNVFSLTLSSAKLASALERKNSMPYSDSGPFEKSPARQRDHESEIELESKCPVKIFQLPQETITNSVQQMSLDAGESGSINNVSGAIKNGIQNGKSSRNQPAVDTSTIQPVVDHWSSNNSYHTEASSTTNESNNNSKPSKKSKKNFVLLGRKHLIKQTLEKKVEEQHSVSLEQQSVTVDSKEKPRSIQEANHITGLSATSDKSITKSTPKNTSTSQEIGIEQTTKRKVSVAQVAATGRLQDEHNSGLSAAELNPSGHHYASQSEPVIEDNAPIQVSLTLSLSSTSDPANGVRRKTRSKSLSSESKKALMSRARALSPQATVTVKKDTASDGKVGQKRSSSMSKKEAIARHSLQRRTLFKNAEVRNDKQNAKDPDGIYFIPRTKVSEESKTSTPRNAAPRRTRGSLLTQKPLGEMHSIFPKVRMENNASLGEVMSLSQKSHSVGKQEVNPTQKVNDEPENQKTKFYQKEARVTSSTGKDSSKESLLERRQAVKGNNNRGAGQSNILDKSKPNILSNSSLYAMNEKDVSHPLTSQKSHDASIQSILSGDSSGARSNSSLAGRAGTILKGRRQKESSNLITQDTKSVLRQDAELAGRSLRQSDRVASDMMTQKNSVPQEAALRKVLERNERVKSSVRDNTRSKDWKKHDSQFMEKKDDSFKQQLLNENSLKTKPIGKGKANGKQTDARLSKRYNRSSRFMDNDISTVMTPFGLTSDGASEHIQHSQSTATAESSFISIETGSTESDSKYQPTETGRPKPSTDEKRRSPTNLVSNQFLKQRAHNVDQVHSVCKNVTVQDLADDLVGEVNQVSADLRSFASGINNRMAALRDCVSRTNESTSDSLLPKCQNLVPFDMEDVAIEVEYLDDSIDEDEEFDDDPAEDFGMCTAHVDQTIDNVDDALGHIRPSIACANSPTGQDSDSGSESESEIEVRNTKQPFTRPQCV